MGNRWVVPCARSCVWPLGLSPTLAEELWQHRRRSAFQGDDELVFCHPERGTAYHAEHFKEALTAVLADAGVEKQLRASTTFAIRLSRTGRRLAKGLWR
jgi:hypothetical protein